jgi:hypothetical protein
MRVLPSAAMLAALSLVPATASAKLPTPTTAVVQPGTNAILECPPHGPGYSFSVSQHGAKLQATGTGRHEVQFGREAIVWTFKNGATFAATGSKAVAVTFWCVP